MTLAQCKKKMLEWKDFYGGDISDTDAIKNAKSKKDLAVVLQQHSRLLEDTAIDAESHLERFKRSLDISLYS